MASLICKQCTHRLAKTIYVNGGGGVTEWQCDIRKIVFGIQRDWDEGKNIPVKCKEFNQVGRV